MDETRAQGATEYLVLLAVVLIIALVSIALLGFFPGMAGDSQMAETQIYWKGASPIAITDTPGAWRNDVTWSAEGAAHLMYLKVRNTGVYPIRLSAILGGGQTLSTYYDFTAGATANFNSIYLAPGEETCIGNYYYPGAYCNNHGVVFFPTSSATGWYKIASVNASCNSDGTGYMKINDFGFDYTQYVEGQALSKRFVGTKPLVVRCIGKYP